MGNIKREILITLFIISGFYSMSFGQPLIDQKLIVISNAGYNGGPFVVEYQLKGTDLGNLKTLSALNADITFDTSVINFENSSILVNGLSQDSGYYTSVSEKFMQHWHSKLLRIFVAGSGVDSSGTGVLNGYDLDTAYRSIVRLSFTILNCTKPIYLFINGFTNKSAVFKNPHNIPRSFEMTGIGLSDPVIIIEKPLPVNLQSFTYRLKDRDVTLNWITSGETNNKGFDIQRKTVTGNEWSEIGFVKGAGTVNGQTSYSFTDKKLNSGEYNYRLKQTDYNGNFTYHVMDGSVQAGLPKKFNLSQNYPNPFNPVTKIDYDIPAMSKVRLTVFDILGREIKVLVNEIKEAGNYTAEYNSAGLASGFYFYTLTAVSDGSEYSITRKMTLLK